MVSEYFSDISNLRFLVFGLGFTSILIIFFKLRNYKAKRSIMRPVFYVSSALVALSLWPILLDMPANILILYNNPGRGSIAFVFLISLILLIFLIFERDRYFKREKVINNLYNKLVINRVQSEYSFQDLNYEIVVIIPAFNEEKNLGKVLDEIPNNINNKPIGVIVVDDGSEDDVSLVCKNKENIILVNHLINRGGGAALRTGYQIAKLLGAKIVVTIDADGQHQPKEISTLIMPIINNDADVVIGSRFLDGDYSGVYIRKIGIKVFNIIINLLFGSNITDCTSGYRAFNLDKLTQINLIQDQYHTAELLIEAMKRKFVIKEVSVEIIQRFSGASKKGTNAFYAYSFLKTVISTWLR